MTKKFRVFWTFITRRVLNAIVILVSLGLATWSLALGVEMAKIAFNTSMTVAFLSVLVYSGAKVIENSILGRVEFKDS